MKVRVNSIDYDVDYTNNSFSITRNDDGLPITDQLLEYKQVLEEFGKNLDNEVLLRNLIEEIKKKISNKEITSSEELKKALEDLLVADNIKEQIYQSTSDLLDISKVSDEYISFDDYLSYMDNYLNEKRTINQTLESKFTVTNGIITHTLTEKDREFGDEVVLSKSFNYDDVAKRGLVNKCVEKICANDLITYNEVVPKTDGINRLGDVFIGNKNFTSLEIDNIEYSYAMEIFDRVNEIVQAKQTNQVLSDDQMNELLDNNVDQSIIESYIQAGLSFEEIKAKELGETRKLKQSSMANRKAGSLGIGLFGIILLSAIVILVIIRLFFIK